MCPYLKTMKVRENKHSCEASLTPNGVFAVNEKSKCGDKDFDTCPIFLAYVLRASIKRDSSFRGAYRRGYRKAV